MNDWAAGVTSAISKVAVSSSAADAHTKTSSSGVGRELSVAGLTRKRSVKEREPMSSSAEPRDVASKPPSASASLRRTKTAYLPNPAIETNMGSRTNQLQRRTSVYGTNALGSKATTSMDALPLPSSSSASGKHSVTTSSRSAAPDAARGSSALRSRPSIYGSIVGKSASASTPALHGKGIPETGSVRPPSRLNGATSATQAPSSTSASGTGSSTISRLLRRPSLIGAPPSSSSSAVPSRTSSSSAAKSLSRATSSISAVVSGGVGSSLVRSRSRSALPTR